MAIDYHNERDDALTDVLDTLQIEGQVFCVSDMSAPWATRKDERNQIYFYAIENGSGFIKFRKGKEKIVLGSGDLVLIPRGDAHNLQWFG
jgi:mannose-6-phosphate isomerase-like protein (cupin superfamily)